MTKILGVEKPWCLTIRKKLGWPANLSSIATFGESIFGDCIFGDFGNINFLTVFGESIFGDCIFGDFNIPVDDPSFGIYQMRKCKEGKIPIKMKFYSPTNPQTEIQQANREKIKNAVLAWQSLTPFEKLVYNENAKGKHLSGYNLFVREYLLSN